MAAEQQQHHSTLHYTREATLPPSPSFCIGICLIRTALCRPLLGASALRGAWAFAGLTRATQKISPGKQKSATP